MTPRFSFGCDKPRQTARGHRPRLQQTFQGLYNARDMARAPSPAAAKGTPPLAFAALHHRNFRFFFIGTMLAMMADNIEHVVSYWLLYQKFHSPALAGFAEISHWTPFLLLSIYFGGIADRYDCRKIVQA